MKSNRKKSNKSYIKNLFFILFTVFIIFLLIFGINFYKKVLKPYKGYENTIIAEIERGSSVSSIAKLLQQKKIITSYFYFKLYYRLFFKEYKLKSGEYQFDRSMTMKQVIKKLNKGKAILYKITIKEGMIIEEIAEFLSTKLSIDHYNFIREAQNVNLIQDIDSKANDLEGYLFPDTYFVRKNITAQEFIKLMVTKFRKNFSNSMHWRAKDINLTSREVITLASLIEKETSSKNERFIISSVFHNRLRLGMPMGCDPTIVYALKKENKYNGKLGWRELKFDSPYNTRLYKGLPPGPICSPGLYSIEAALFPVNTKYLYFVAKDSKNHHFSRSLKEHNWAVKKFIINKKNK
jgi:UPF0755 protein